MRFDPMAEKSPPPFNPGFDPLQFAAQGDLPVAVAFGMSPARQSFSQQASQ
jgi:hypothetical protein